jgi:hypothetical protein
MSRILPLLGAARILRTAGRSGLVTSLPVFCKDWTSGDFPSGDGELRTETKVERATA